MDLERVGVEGQALPIDELFQIDIDQCLEAADVDAALSGAAGRIALPLADVVQPDGNATFSQRLAIPERIAILRQAGRDRRIRDAVAVRCVLGTGSEAEQVAG